MISKTKRTPKDEFEKSMLLLENDVDALGWDQPARIYAILGDDDDLRMELMDEIEGHPVDYMRDMVAQGHFDPSVKGVALVTEGWRHPTFDEFKALDGWPMLVKLAEMHGLSAEEAEKKAEKAFHYANSMMRPSENPYRGEIRNVIVVMRDQRILGVHRDRGSEAELIDGMMGGRVDMAMSAMLSGVWPEEDI